ncbi:MAG: hypothetical protein UX26_C0016G0008 [Parcubacteria group bacterium GW2011_GWC1_45_9]|nr:MAG: hypothetical protein UW89_C0008G0005 [Parcubacteria group bacterium GW2011_GWB1_45_10]KKU16789.1 MAG: hypothetical protein UX26_C0016G0008 [Parcubacteria group bacterium GW2011_GWC1_45_9]
MEIWQALALHEIRLETLEQTQVFQRCELVEFVSFSRGRAIIPKSLFSSRRHILLKHVNQNALLVRVRRKKRELSFLRVKNSKTISCYPVINGEIRNPKHHRFVAIDVLAAELLENLPWEERIIDNLLNKARTATREKQKAKKIKRT